MLKKYNFRHHFTVVISEKTMWIEPPTIASSYGMVTASADAGKVNQRKYSSHPHTRPPSL
jgi:hypothetical protein